MTVRAVFAIVASIAIATATCAQEVDWPKEIEASEGKIIIYQPQPESLKGNVLTGRAAMSLELKGKSEPVFGAFWFTAKLNTDQAADKAIIRDVKVTKAGWRDSSTADEQRFTKIVEAAIPTSGYEISRERLSASLKTAEREQKSLSELKNDPPKIVFTEQLAVLLMYDGEPRFSAIESSDYERVLNTPFAVARNKKTKVLYLSSGTTWYTAKDPMGPWATLASPPADLVAMLPKPEATDVAPKVPPQIFAATTPTELIATEGAPKWKSLPGGQLLYVENTETAWLRELTSNQMYVLLSGRWFKAASQNGPWVFVRADQLPASFKDIPPGSDIGGLRVSVAGTDEAEDAVLDSQIPQTAAIKRSEATLEVQYDGAPKFEKIAGTQVSYAVNTSAQVLQIAAAFYAVDNGVWFTAVTPSGPWKVADKIPDQEIQQIPPSSPVYNTTYVYVYDSTPDVVYVGYTPGYMWAYPYYGVPVYGTGYYYPPYWGPYYYYPRPPTWGFHVGYNPWTGWNFGVTWSNGFMSMGVRWGGGYGHHHHHHHCCGGWYGGGYRGPVIINTGNINIGNNVNIGNQTNIGNKIGNGNRVGNANTLRDNANIYGRSDNKLRNAAPAKPMPNAARVARDRDNNLYADKSGTVARRTGEQWETRNKGSWQPEQRLPTSSKPSQFDRVDLNRSYQARSHGASREKNVPAQRRQREK